MVPTAERKTGGVVVIAVLPPPVTGMTLVTAALVEEIKRSARRNVVLKTSRTDYSDNKVSWRVRHQLVLLFKTVYLPLLKLAGYTHVYIVADSKWGLTRTLVQLSIASLLRFKVILHHHSYRYILEHSVLMSAIAFIGSTSTTHIFLCADMHEQFESQYRPVKGTVLSNKFIFTSPKVKHREIEPQTNKRNHLKLGFLSNITQEKGIEAFARLIRDLVAEGDGIEARIAGNCLDTISESVVADLTRDHDGIVEFSGPVYGKHKDEFFQSIDLLVFPSLYEAQPLVIFESFQAGVPVIALERGCIREQVGLRGWVVSSYDELLSTCRLLLAEPGLLSVTRDQAMLDDDVDIQELRTRFEELWK